MQNASRNSSRGRNRDGPSRRTRWDAAADIVPRNAPIGAYEKFINPQRPTERPMPPSLFQNAPMSGPSHPAWAGPSPDQQQPVREQGPRFMPDCGAQFQGQFGMGNMVQNQGPFEQMRPQMPDHIAQTQFPNEQAFNVPSGMQNMAMPMQNMPMQNQGFGPMSLQPAGPMSMPQETLPFNRQFPPANEQSQSGPHGPQSQNDGRLIDHDWSSRNEMQKQDLQPLFPGAERAVQQPIGVYNDFFQQQQQQAQAANPTPLFHPGASENAIGNEVMTHGCVQNQPNDFKNGGQNMTGPFPRHSQPFQTPVAQTDASSNSFMPFGGMQNNMVYNGVSSGQSSAANARGPQQTFNGPAGPFMNGQRDSNFEHRPEAPYNGPRTGPTAPGAQQGLNPTAWQNTQQNNIGMHDYDSTQQQQPVAFGIGEAQAPQPYGPFKRPNVPPPRISDPSPSKMTRFGEMVGAGNPPSIGDLFDQSFDTRQMQQECEQLRARVMDEKVASDAVTDIANDVPGADLEGSLLTLAKSDIILSEMEGKARQAGHNSSFLFTEVDLLRAKVGDTMSKAEELQETQANKSSLERRLEIYRDLVEKQQIVPILHDSGALVEIGIELRKCARALRAKLMRTPRNYSNSDADNFLTVITSIVQPIILKMARQSTSGSLTLPQLLGVLRNLLNACDLMRNEKAQMEKVAVDMTASLERRMRKESELSFALHRR